ncbi:MAG: FAD-binding oxidoreductase [Rhodobacteraceae bacterium]|nr:FAD-binding oxidoreductase [Paracoccaceae bacterium]
MDLLQELEGVLGKANLLRGDDTKAYRADWMGKYSWHPLAVARPADTDEVAAVMRLAHEAGMPVVPISGNTGLAGGTNADGVLMLSLGRMNKVREIRQDARIAIVEAGVILSSLHDAVDAQGLRFPMTFGARGSAMLGGLLSTNAGGSNVLRYGNTRALCLGLEVVLADGQVLDIMSELHKDNSGYDLKDLFIGAEGTLGIITAAVMKLVPAPRAHATAMVAAPSLSGALVLLNRLQEATGGAVEAFEYMPGSFVDAHLEAFPKARAPFEARHDVNILVEVGATAPRDAMLAEDGSLPVVTYLEEVLVGLMEEGAVLDAVIAQSDAQRNEMWARREAAAEVMTRISPRVDTDIALPLDGVATFLERMEEILPSIDDDARHLEVAHLGDGNIHFSVLCSRNDPALMDQITEQVEEVVVAMGGSFSAEHGIGISKKPSMARRKNPVALALMRQVKTALDPKGIMNPGKVLPDA